MATITERRNARNAYFREYYRTHKDVVRATQQKYWDKKAEQMKAEREQKEQDKTVPSSE